MYNVHFLSFFAPHPPQVQFCPTLAPHTHTNISYRVSKKPPKFATFLPFLTRKSYIHNAKVPIQGLKLGYFMGKRKYRVHIGINLFP